MARLELFWNINFCANTSLMKIIFSMLGYTIINPFVSQASLILLFSVHCFVALLTSPLYEYESLYIRNTLFSHESIFAVRQGP